MIYEQTKEEFLNRHTDGAMYDSSRIMYARKIDVFFEFLHRECSINDGNYKYIFEGIDIAHIIKSVNFYIEEYNIGFKATIDGYFTVVSEYFRFLSEKYNIVNSNFDKESVRKEMQKEINKVIKERKLNDSEQKSPITRTTFNKLLKHCDDIISDFDIQEEIPIEGKRATRYQKFTSAIIVKLVMLVGVKNNVVSKIKFKDYIGELNLVKVNNFEFHLPKKLSLQLQKYLKVRERLTQEKGDYPLFVLRDGKAIGTYYNFMFDVLADVVGNRKGECLSKYVVMEMIKKGINFNMILELTSLGIPTCSHCQELVNEERSEEDNTAAIRYLESKIRGMEIFDML